MSNENALLYFRNNLKHLEDKFNKFVTENGLDIFDFDELLHSDFELLFSGYTNVALNRNLLFQIFDLEQQEVFHTLCNCASSEEAITDKLTKFLVDEVEYAVFFDEDYFVVVIKDCDAQDANNFVNDTLT